MARSKFSLVSAAVLVGLAGAGAKANLIAYEGFNYNAFGMEGDSLSSFAHPITGGYNYNPNTSGWSTVAPANNYDNPPRTGAPGWQAPQDINQYNNNATESYTTQGLTYPGLPSVGGSERDNGGFAGFPSLPLATPITNATGTTFVSALFNLNPNGQTVIGVRFGDITNPTTQFEFFGLHDDGSNIYPTIGDPTQGNSLFPGNGIDASASVSANTTHLLVAELNADSHTLSLFVDPTAGSAYPGDSAAVVSTSNVASNFTWNMIGLGRLFGVTESRIDEIRVGTSWADVTSAVVASHPPTWVRASSGSWDTAAAWDGTPAGAPNGIDAEADFVSTLNGSTVGFVTNGTISTDSSKTLGTIKFNNSTAVYSINGAYGTSLTMQVSSGSALIDVQSTGTQQINIPLILASNTKFQTDVAGANLLISNPLTINPGVSLNTSGPRTVTYQSTITLLSGATMNIASSSQAHALSLAASSKAVISSSPTNGPRTVLQLDSASLASTSTVDLTNNKLVINGGNLSAINASVATAYHGGAWDGNGISSSTAATDPTHLHAVGVAQVGSVVTAEYTYYGDANLNGAVDSADYSRIDYGYLSHLTGWQNGDFNYDSVINGSDYTLIDNAFNAQGAALPSGQLALSTAQVAGSASAVPEPASLGMLALAAAGFIGRRRRS